MKMLLWQLAEKKIYIYLSSVNIFFSSINDKKKTVLISVLVLTLQINTLMELHMVTWMYYAYECTDCDIESRVVFDVHEY